MTREPGWEQRLTALFDDLEQQADALFTAEREAEVAERSRSEYAAVTLATRLMAARGTEVGLVVEGVGTVSGLVHRVAGDWCLVGAPVRTGSSGCPRSLRFGDSHGRRSPRRPGR